MTEISIAALAQVYDEVSMGQIVAPVPRARLQEAARVRCLVGCGPNPGPGIDQASRDVYNRWVLCSEQCR